MSTRRPSPPNSEEAPPLLVRSDRKPRVHPDLSFGLSESSWLFADASTLPHAHRRDKPSLRGTSRRRYALSALWAAPASFVSDPDLPACRADENRAIHHANPKNLDRYVTILSTHLVL
jgi:hypothetical protein